LSDETIQSGVAGPLPGSRIESANASNLAAMAESFQALRRNPVNMNTLNLVNMLSRKYKVSASQIAIQWLLQTGVVTSVCIGVQDAEELDQNMSCLLGEFILSQEDVLFEQYNLCFFCFLFNF
jgi:aryl-alcohol dehydrogenase-like predicted oxidoreductase